MFQCKEGIVEGVGAAVYPGHESYETLKKKELEHVQRVGKIEKLDPKFLYSSDYAGITNFQNSVTLYILYHSTYSKTPIYRASRGKGKGPVNRGTR